MNCRAKRMECVQLAGAFERCRAPESGSKLHALQTLRAVRLRPGRVRDHTLYLVASAGIENQNVAPWPGWDSTQMVPPCRSTIFLQIASPMPVPG